MLEISCCSCLWRSQTTTTTAAKSRHAQSAAPKLCSAAGVSPLAAILLLSVPPVAAILLLKLDATALDGCCTHCPMPQHKQLHSNQAEPLGHSSCRIRPQTPHRPTSDAATAASAAVAAVVCHRPCTGSYCCTCSYPSTAACKVG